MAIWVLFLVVIALSIAGFYMGRGRALAVAGGKPQSLHSLPSYHGWYVIAWCGLPALLLLGVWIMFEDAILRSIVVGALPPAISGLPADKLGLVVTDIRNLAGGVGSVDTAPPDIKAAVAHYLSLRGIANAAMWVVVLLVFVAGAMLARGRISPNLRSRNATERVLQIILLAAATIAILTTIGIVLSLIFEAFAFFSRVPPQEFLFGLVWSPQTALRAEQVGSSGAFGAVPLFVGTLLIAVIAMVTAVPIGLMAAVYMSEYAHTTVRAIAKPALEVLAGIPTVVYGFFAALTVAPAIREAGGALGLEVASQSALAAGLVMGVMIIPFVSSLSDDVINAVPRSLREGAYAVGATQAETIRQVILPAALPGIAASVVLAFSRALGETMIVVMAAGLAANLTINPLAAVTTVTVHIAALLVGDQEFDSPKTLAAFALGLVLFLVTLSLNIFALRLVNKYRERYD